MIWSRWAQLVLLLLLGCAAAMSAPLLAGAGKRPITPPPDIGHVSLGGFGDRQGAAYEGVHDEISARALAVRSGDTTCVVIALDRLEVPRFLHEDVCAALADLPGGFPIGPQSLIITASHTHSAPENLARHGDIFPLAFGRYNEQLYRWTVAQIAAAVEAAVSALRPASLGSAQARLDGLSANRRGDDTTDPVLTAVWIVAEDGAPIAVLANFPAHPTMLGADNLLISGEWPGAAERLVEEQLGGDAVCLFTNGTQGDQRPAGDFGSGFDRVERFGRRIADEIMATQAAVNLDSEPKLSIAGAEVALPPRQPSPAFAQAAREEYPIPAELMAKVLSAVFPDKARLQAVVLGDAMMITVPGEMIAALGIELKTAATEAGIARPFIAGLANTYCGYILTPEEYDEGGYESAVSVYGSSFGPWLVGELSTLIDAAGK